MAKKMLKKEVLRKKEDFNSVYKRGKSIPDKFVVMFYKKNGLSYNRVAFLASKKVGNSVKRNRAKRLMRESCRLSGEHIENGYDIIFIARKTINGKKFEDVDKSLKGALRRGNMI